MGQDLENIETPELQGLRESGLVRDLRDPDFIAERVNPAIPQPSPAQTVIEGKFVEETDEFHDDGIEPEGYFVPEGKEPNVKLSGLKKHQALPKGPVNIGMNPSIIIPSRQTQEQGFYVEDPAVLCTQFTQYKRIEEKGQ